MLSRPTPSFASHDYLIARTKTESTQRYEQDWETTDSRIFLSLIFLSLTKPSDKLRHNNSVSIHNPPSRIRLHPIVPTVAFTENLKRHITCPAAEVEATTVREALDAVFSDHEQLRGYVLDDQNRLRQHMVIFIDGQPITDRNRLSDAVTESSEIYVMQALSGG